MCSIDILLLMLAKYKMLQVGLVNIWDLVLPDKQLYSTFIPKTKSQN